jgi:hypothetical protein
MTAEELWQFETDQITSNITSAAQLEITKKRELSSTQSMLRHLRNELAEHNKKKPLKVKT